MKQKIILLIAIIYLPSSLWSQATQNFIPNVFSPAPNVAGLIKYAEVPVSNYNGTASFSVPLYDIKENDINLPISLSYYSNGLKVEEEASWVGLGWNINAGGVIQHISNRDENEGPDVIPNYITANPSQDLPYVNSECYLTTNKLQGGCEYQSRGGGIIEVSNYTIHENKGYKYEMFLYNFAGYSGKFIIDRGGNIVVLDQSNIIFTVTGKDNLDNPVAVYAITPDGNKYSFEIVGFSESRYSPGGPCSSLPGLNIVHNNSYYLSKIVTPLKNEITFDYTLNITKSLPRTSETFTHYLYSSDVYKDSRILSTSTNEIYEYLLKSVKTSNTEIKFNLSERDDILNGKRLNNITIHKRNEISPIKSINFNYNYFEGNLFFGDSNDQSAITFPYKTPTCRTALPAVDTNLKSKRLKLLNIFFSKEPVASYTANFPKFSFEYESGIFPYKTSLSYDLWGYFNGAGASKSAIPNLQFIDFYDNNLPAYYYETQNLENGKRQTNTMYSKMGLLNKITQPTGGYTKIMYEANSFYAPDVTTPILDKSIDVTDYNSTTEQSQVFELSSFVINNPITLDVTLNCNNDGPCQQSGDCPPYEAVSDQSMITAGHDYRLFAILEKKNPDYSGGWQPVFKYGRNSPELLQEGPCNHHFLDSQVRSRLQANTQYRIRVNYPDEKIGQQGRAWAQMRLNYKEQDTITKLLGAGLRVASIAEWDGTKSYNEKKYSYSGGKLMTKPVFYQTRSSYSGFIGSNPNYNVTSLNEMATYKRLCNALGQNFTNYIPDVFVRLSSEAQVPYSYGANGSLVGYNTVKISYGDNKTLTQNPIMGNGIEEYNYINTPDNLFFYDGLIPGISGSKFMNNGLLISKKNYRIRHIASYTIPAPPPPGQNAGVYYVREIYPVKTEFYNYDVRNYKDYWAFKADYASIQFSDGTPATDSRYYFLHFYPIKTGKVILKSKTETNYSSSLLPKETVVNITDYVYNSKFQLINETTKNSLNKVVENKTYYPDDLKNSGFQQAQMQELITQNRIDLPIKSELLINGSSVSKTETKYIKDISTGNLLLPKEIHSLKGLSQINITNSNDRKITFNQYDDKGNIQQYTAENGIPVSIIWGYNKTQPIAKIENATYSQVASYASNLQTLSETGTEANLILDLNTMRAALPNAMVTTYTYIPLVGVSSITDPKENKIVYTYDALGRLEFIKDKDGNILSENQYNYKQ